MENKYFVLYKRDIPTEKQKRYQNKMLYDKIKEFPEKENALEFATLNLPSALVQRYPLNPAEVETKNPETPYLIAAEFFGKYSHYCCGEGEFIKTYDVKRCKQEDVESTIEKFAKEDRYEKALVGLELKILGG